MGLFDFLKSKEQTSAATPASPTVAARYLGDLTKTAALARLVTIPRADRDAAWNAAFLADLAAASFRCGTPQVVQGPDGMPYVQLFLPEEGVSFTCYVIENMKDDFLLEQGLGVVINPTATGPDWVLSYGDILNLHLNQVFYSTEETPFSKQRRDEVIEGAEEVLVAQPAELLLPQVTRDVLCEFLKNNGVAAPKVLLLMRRGGGGAGLSQDLVFNITPLDFENEEMYRWVMQQLAWFLPRHYSLVGMEEKAIKSGFMPL